MTTPIVDFVKNYADKKGLRLHMPGHKGNGFLGVEQWDITEIEGADVLYSAQGIIRQSEKNAATLFNTQKTVYSTEGSSLAIRAMLYLVKLYAKKQGMKPFVVAGRNSHKTFLTASALLEIDVDWLLPDNARSVISCEITADFFEKYILKSKKKPVALYITSPDYLGNTADISGLATVCKKYGILLLVDNAHGAYLNFLPNSCHPISLGADMCCDSAHKTLPVLTGGAYLHISPSADVFFAQNAERAMSLFASTSPSYLILQSLDAANAYLSNEYPEKLKRIYTLLNELKVALAEKGYNVIGDEPLKLTLSTKQYGYIGVEMAELLAQKNITCEFSDPDYVVMMFTPEIGDIQIDNLKKALMSIDQKMPINETPPIPEFKNKRLSPNLAINLPCIELDIDDCVGKIAAAPTVMCPPAVPIVICGEEVDENVVKAFKYYGINKCLVVDDEYL